MPASPSKPCRHPGCAALVTVGSYCPPHIRVPVAKAVYDATRRRDDPALAEAARIRNSARWQRFRHWFRARHPLCSDPFGDHGEMQAPAKQVHHVLSLATRPDLACDETNCRPICTVCHARIEGMERAGQPTAHLFDNSNEAA